MAVDTLLARSPRTVSDPAVDWRFTTADAWDRAIRIDHPKRRQNMRGVLLWALGIPLPVIILLYLFHVI